jgi:hypothetical protein
VLHQGPVYKRRALLLSLAALTGVDGRIAEAMGIAQQGLDADPRGAIGDLPGRFERQLRRSGYAPTL